MTGSAVGLPGDLRAVLLPLVAPLPEGLPRQRLATTLALGVLTSAATAQFSAVIPNNTAFSGVHIQGQTAVFAAGLNALGVITSNGLDLGIGIN